MATYLELNDIDSCEYIDDVKTVYDLSIENNHNYMLSVSGKKVLVHNSGKTYAFLQICLILLLTQKGLKITVWRNIRAVCRATVLEDFEGIIANDFSLWSKFKKNKQEGKFTCKTTGSVIQFEGCDSPSKVLGMRQNIAFFNEVTEISELVYDQITQRTDDLIICDYNPSKKFWLDKYQKNDNTIYYHSNFAHNPFLSAGIVEKLKSYEPWEPGSYDVDYLTGHITHLSGAPVRHKLNHHNDTVNKFMWMVYGLGVTAEKPNKVLKEFARCTNKYYEELTYQEYFGLDFGLRNPTALVGVKFDGDRTFFIKQYLYKPSSQFGTTVPDYLWRNVRHLEKSDMLIADSAKLSDITDMTNYGYNCLPASKGPGSFERGIGTLQSFNLVVTVESVDLIAENSGYEYRIDRYGLASDEIVRKDDHLIDGARYVISFIVSYLGIRV